MKRLAAQRAESALVSLAPPELPIPLLRLSPKESNWKAVEEEAMRNDPATP